MEQDVKILLDKLFDGGIIVDESNNEGIKWYYIVDGNGEVFDEFSEGSFTKENLLNYATFVIPKHYLKGSSPIHDEYIELGRLITNCLLPKR